MHPKYWKPHRNHFLRAPTTGEGEAGGASSIVDAFSSFLDEEPKQEESTTAQQEQRESLDAAAERLAAEEAASANQNQSAEGEQEPAEEVAEDSTVEIEVDGKPVKLTKAELAEHYKNGLRQKDYTRKTMEVSEQRKQADAEVQRARAERETYAQQLTNFALTSESILAEQEKALTEELLRNDPVEYMALERTFRKRQADLASAQAELQRINGERQKEQQQSTQQFLKEQSEKLVEMIPEWKDEGKRKAGLATLESFIESRGFTANDGLALLDARFLSAMHDAMKYRDLMTRAKETHAKVKAAPPKVERPGTAQVAPTDGRTRLMKELKATGNRNVAAQLFESFV